ncbi:MAG: bifunctional demethylmenaquinone methyltransferase/2-methoxy-6-polyprenyl-1,4-benzoquinol methylase UbiE [Bacteroidetes bacterium]|nr:bifunctional demethylmenaquinone methyltransferase/2-methoxy-6-polyprenyl-1,4-benzoquinol methylase UbiE [Bacteroidota bacterium]MBL0096344.1 bifunctional demethylmenaquinone methyltransferase/2-methoxy-6-polyprenyl-1,4-benzoquinol methylase UbiE [Bacteroidota bacterium]
MTVIPQHYKGSTKRERVEEMFDSIATRYDLLNKVLSAGIDKSWRKKAIDELIAIKPNAILDIATGTADLALECMRLKPAEIIGIDISNKMLDIGRHKIMAKGYQGIIRLEQADSEQLPYDEARFDAITVAFGVRNFEHLEEGLKEMYRVLRPGGKVVILEFSQPDRFPVKQFYNFYSYKVMPKIGQMLSKERSAYEYLPASVSAFPHGKNFLSILTKTGFKDTKSIPLTFGIASIYTGIK